MTSGNNQPPKRKPGRIIEIIPDGKVTLCSNPGMNLGPVTKIIALPSSSNKYNHLSLKDLARQRMEKQANPNFNSLQEYYDI